MINFIAFGQAEKFLENEKKQKKLHKIEKGQYFGIEQFFNPN